MADAARKIQQEPYRKALVVHIGKHYFAAPIDHIQDVILRNPTTRVPLASRHVVGLLNLRGHVVTEMNVAYTLGLDEECPIADSEGFSIVINNGSEMFSMVFQGVGDVIDIPTGEIEQLPDTINSDWLKVAHGVYRTPERLLVILDFGRLLDLVNPPSEMEEQ